MSLDMRTHPYNHYSDKIHNNFITQKVPDTRFQLIFTPQRKPLF